jgi:RNA polymerase sigma-70 factor, ECF subfamily
MIGKAKKSSDAVVRLPDRQLGDAEIVDGLRRRDPRSAAALYDCYGDMINGLVWRLLGADAEHDDVVQLVFVHILSSINKLKSPDALKMWISGIAVNTVRREIRSRKYRRILVLHAECPERVSDDATQDQKLMTSHVYRILDKMRTEDHIAFALRFIDGNTLGEVAVAGGYSLATAKRRVAHAKKEFMKRAKDDIALGNLLEEGADD